MKRFFSKTLMLICLVGLFMLLSSMAMASVNHTQVEAADWARDRANEKWNNDYDGANGVQCVDLTKYYFDYLGLGKRTGYARDYAGFYIDGLTNIAYYNGFIPEPGDIAVWTVSDGSDVGHVGIVISADSSEMTDVDCRGWNRDIGSHVFAYYSSAKYSRTSSDYFYGVLRPDFADNEVNGYAPVDLGDSFFAFIRHQSKNVYLTNQLHNIAGEAFTGETTQIWSFNQQNNGAYAISSAYDGACFDVLGNSTEGGTNVYAYGGGFLGNENQQFYIYHMYDAYYFSPVYGYGKHMLDMNENNYNLELWGVGENWSPQEFDIYIIPSVDAALPVNLGTGFYAYIRHQTKDVYLTNQSHNIAGEAFTGDKGQIWRFDRHADGSYVIWSAADNSCMDVLGVSTEDGANVYAYGGGYEGLSNQRFFIYKLYGAYCLSPVHANGKSMLDMSESTYNLEVWGFGRDWSPQKFDIEAVRYVVSYDANGGNAAPEAQVKGYGGKLVLSADVPTREGFVFLGWATSPDSRIPEYQPGDIYAMDADLTLYAIWLMPDFILPAGLVRVEDEAFVGGAFRYVFLPDGTQEIGRRAFANCPNLEYVRIPEEVEIAEDAFDGVKGLTIYGLTGGSTETYAAAHNFDFIPEP